VVVGRCWAVPSATTTTAPTSPRAGAASTATSAATPTSTPRRPFPPGLSEIHEDETCETASGFWRRAHAGSPTTASRSSES
jgi:hypothetical protein